MRETFSLWNKRIFQSVLKGSRQYVTEEEVCVKQLSRSVFSNLRNRNGQVSDF